jgi:hypothetical protein
MQPISARLKNTTREMSDATIAIWNYIKNYRQPVVVVVDSNKRSGRSVIDSQKIPVLHYIVIKGISETTSGGKRNFMVNDSAVYYDDLTYSESDLRKLIAMPANAPEWVYKYGNQKVGLDPAYILTVQGD